MKIPEAIESLGDLLATNFMYSPASKKDALKLGIEALEFLSQWERDHNGEKLVLLPGETEEKGYHGQSID